MQAPFLLVADWSSLLWPVSQKECHLEPSLQLLLLYTHVFVCCWLEGLAGCLDPWCRQEWLLDAVFLQVSGTQAQLAWLGYEVVVCQVCQSHLVLVGPSSYHVLAL